MLRGFHSHRHFTGSHEDINRAEDESEVVNDVSILDLGATYAINTRLHLFMNAPLMAASRSMPIRDTSSVVIDRYINRAAGLGDISAGVRGWLMDPATTPTFNIGLGLGAKFPSGVPNVVDTRRRFNAATKVIDDSIATVDQSIQPGDGGYGALLQLYGFWSFIQSAAIYLDGSYLFNPQDTNGVRTYRARASESVMSIADQYILRIGASWAPASLPGLGLSLGGRIEGVPVRDVIGPSDGFRRPGFSISLDPAVSYEWGSSSVSLSVPVALYRERQKSIPDIIDDTHGDAAFADYLISVSYTHTF